MTTGVVTPISRSSESIARPSFPGITTSEKTMSKRSARIRATARAAHASYSSLPRDIDMERSAAPVFALHPDAPTMVRHDRLNNRETETGAVLFRRVVGREQPPSFLLRQPAAGVRDLDSNARRPAAR